MDTQVSFVTDKRLKEQVLNKARKEGITLKALMVYAMKGFLDDKISLSIVVGSTESDVEEIFFDDAEINKTAVKLARLLK